MGRRPKRRHAGVDPRRRRGDESRWVQLPFAGIENFVDHLDDDYVWTCGKGVYAEPVAEMALALGVAGLRNVGGYARASTWSGPAGHNLIGGHVTILGGGGITESLVRLLQPWNCHITVVRNNVEHMDGVDDVLESDRFADALPDADLVVLALPLTSETEGLFSPDEFELMQDHAWIVNVARGGHIVTDHLVDALHTGMIGGAGLDVTDPEPLPDGHPLWSMPNCIITPHVGNTPEMAKPLLAARVTDNVRRFAVGRGTRRSRRRRRRVLARRPLALSASWPDQPITTRCECRRRRPMRRSETPIGSWRVSTIPTVRRRWGRRPVGCRCRRSTRRTGFSAIPPAAPSTTPGCGRPRGRPGVDSTDAPSTAARPRTCAVSSTRAMSGLLEFPGRGLLVAGLIGSSASWCWRSSPNLARCPAPTVCSAWGVAW